MNGIARLWRWDLRWPALAVVMAGAGLFALPAQGRGPAGKQDRTKTSELLPVALPASKEAQVLFSGKEDELKTNWVRRNTDQPAQWKIIENGAMRVGGGDIETKQPFTDMQLHIEFKVPLLPPDVRGQGRGNSGIGLQGRYEIQVLDSFGIDKPGKGDCGAVYSQAAALVNACKPPQEWQSYDIVFRAARFDADGKKSANARVTVMQNGIIVQNNQEITGPTGIGAGPEDKPGKIVLQDHGNTVEYRNIWVIPLPPEGSDKY